MSNLNSVERFNCDRCGLCCQNLKMSDLYSSLDRGDGVCKYFDSSTNLCTIYECRPILCNIDYYYDENLKDKISRQEWHDLNSEICQKLKRFNYSDIMRNKR